MFLKIICFVHYPSDQIMVFHNIVIVCTTSVYIGTTKNQRDIYHYSFQFHFRFNFEQKRKLSSTKNILYFTTRLQYTNTHFSATSWLNVFFFYHMSFLYSTTVLVLSNPNLCTNLSIYYCINPRIPSDN